MSIRNCIDARALNARLMDIEVCAEHAPDGTHEHAKNFVRVLGEIADGILGKMQAAGFPISNCDGIREIEAVICGAALAGDWAALINAEEFGRDFHDTARLPVILRMLEG